MTYRELLKLYKQGKLEDSAKKQIEAEIEKQDAISEFLYEEGEIPGFSDLESENAGNLENEEWLTGQQNNQKEQSENQIEKKNKCIGDSRNEQEDEFNRRFIKEIQRSIRKAFIKMGMIVGAAVLVVVLCAVFILPKVVSKFYYDPNEVAGKYEEMTTTRMELDMSVYSELFLPGNHRDQVNAVSRGYGNMTSSFHRLPAGRENLLPSADAWFGENLLSMITMY